MCELGMILTLGSTLIGAMGQMQQANATAAAERYNAQIGDMNAKIAERRAEDAIDRGKFEEQRKRQEVAKVKGAQVAAMAANGVDLTFGSPLDTIVDTAVLGELDALTIRTNAYREAYDYRVDAANKRAGANLSRMRADNAQQGGYLSAMGTVLTGAGKMYQSFASPRAGTIGAIS